jgi:hypothetical protein
MIGFDALTESATVEEPRPESVNLLVLLRRVLYLATSGGCSVPWWHNPVFLVA